MLNVYEKIHKGQRAWFGRLLIALGASGAGTPAAAAALAEAGALLAHLRAHAEHEERFIHPLLEEAAPAIAARLRAEHETIDAAMVALAHGAELGDPKRVYRDLSLLASQYFRHLDVEEHEAMPVLNSAFDDGALQERIFMPFGASRTLDDVVTDLRLQLLALTPAESQELLAGMFAR
jgi:hypothetical protein